MSKARAKEVAQEAVALKKKGQVIVKKSKELQAEVILNYSWWMLWFIATIDDQNFNPMLKT
ncbi:unnamed protein product, partial [Nesidiocoris tenuis]